MAEPNQKEHAYSRVRLLYARSKLSAQEVADLTSMSLNTVKKVLFGPNAGRKEAHLNSILRVERELDQYLTSLQNGALNDKILLLTGDPKKDVITLAIELAKTMQELVFDPENAALVDRGTLARVLKSCDGQLSALEI